MAEKITTCLWFDNQAEEAADFYVAVFDGGKVLDVSRYGEGGPARQARQSLCASKLMAGRLRR